MTGEIKHEVYKMHLSLFRSCPTQGPTVSGNSQAVELYWRNKAYHSSSQPEIKEARELKAA